jgi:chromosome segregation ATPase
MSGMEHYGYFESTKMELFKPILLSIPGSEPESPHLSSPSIEVGVVLLSEGRSVSEVRGEDAQVSQLVKGVSSVQDNCLTSQKDFTTIETIEERMLSELKAVTDQQKETKAKMDEMSTQMDEMKDKLENIIRAINRYSDELKQSSAPYLVQLQRRTESDDRLCESLMTVSQTHVTEV